MLTNSQVASAKLVATTPPTRRRSLADLFATDLRALPVVIGLIALGVFFSFENSIFLSPRNLSNLVIQSTVTGILALGLTFVLLVKEIDLSIAAISGVTSVLMAKLIVDFGVPVWAAILISMAVGALLAATSARWVTWIGVPSFVVTLGLGLALNGLQLMLLPSTGRYSLLGTGVEKIAGTSIAGVWAWSILAIGLRNLHSHLGLELHPASTRRSRGVGNPPLGSSGWRRGRDWSDRRRHFEQHQGVPVIAVIFAALLALASYIVNSTQFGLYLFAVGNSDEAARRAGVNVARIKMAAFAISGAVAALAGTIAASRILGVSVSSGGGIGGGALLLKFDRSCRDWRREPLRRPWAG